MKRRTRFITWAKRDTNDERKINYTFRDRDGNTQAFTSDDYCGFVFMERLRQAWIETIELINGEWYATLYED